MNLIGWILEGILIIICVILFRKGLKASDTKKASNLKSASIITFIALSACIFILFPKGSDIPESAYDHDEEAAAHLEGSEEDATDYSDEYEDDYSYEDESEEYDTGDLDDYEVEDTINTFIDDNFSFDVTMDNFELNEHMGTDDEDDYIALVYLDMPTAISVKKGYDWIDKYTNYLAAELAGEYEDIHELVIFWKLAGSENNVAKYVLKREGKNFVFESKWQNPNVTD